MENNYNSYLNAMTADSVGRLYWHQDHIEQASGAVPATGRSLALREIIDIGELHCAQLARAPNLDKLIVNLEVMKLRRESHKNELSPFQKSAVETWDLFCNFVSGRRWTSTEGRIDALVVELRREHTVWQDLNSAAVLADAKATAMATTFGKYEQQLVEDGFFKKTGNTLNAERKLNVFLDEKSDEFTKSSRTDIDQVTFINQKFDESYRQIAEYAQQLKTDGEEAHIAFNTLHFGGKAHCLDFGFGIQEIGVGCMVDYSGHNGLPAAFHIATRRQIEMSKNYASELQILKNRTTHLVVATDVVALISNLATSLQYPCALTHEFRHQGDRYIAYALSGDSATLIYSPTEGRLEIQKSSICPFATRIETGIRKIPADAIVINTTDGFFDFVSNSNEDRAHLTELIQGALISDRPAHQLLSTFKNAVYNHEFGNGNPTGNLLKQDERRGLELREYQPNDSSKYDDLGLTWLGPNVTHPLVVSSLL